MPKISGNDVYSAIGIDPKEQKISSGPNEGDTYYRATFEGKTFIVTEQFFEDWTNGEVAEVTLTESEYFVDDPMNADQKIRRTSWRINYATITQIEKVVANQEKIATIQHSAKVQRKAAEVKQFADMKLTDDQMNKLLAAI